MGAKFQLRMTILIFWAKFDEKWCFRSKTENSHLSVFPWSFLTALKLFRMGGNIHNGICNKTGQRLVRRLLMSVKARKARINDG